MIEATPDSSSWTSTQIAFVPPASTVVLSNPTSRMSGATESDSDEVTVKVPPVGAFDAVGAWSSKTLSAPSVMEIHDTYQMPDSAARGIVSGKLKLVASPGGTCDQKGRVAERFGLRTWPRN